MLVPEDTILVIVDIQEKLTAAMYDKEALVENAVKMVKGAQVLGIPIVSTEQNPDGLGRTIPPIAELLKDTRSFSKLTFSCCGERPFVDELEKIDRHQILIGGIECHVCVYQSVVDLLDLGYEVEVITDMVSSRTPENKEIGLAKCEAYGAYLTSVETALFELLQVAKGEKFKKMLQVVK
jgi:nicotinamidase-related amidase